MSDNLCPLDQAYKNAYHYGRNNEMRPYPGHYSPVKETPPKKEDETMNDRLDEWAKHQEQKWKSRFDELTQKLEDRLAQKPKEENYRPLPIDHHFNKFKQTMKGFFNNGSLTGSLVNWVLIALVVLVFFKVIETIKHIFTK
jgi:hypothetical protein